MIKGGTEKCRIMEVTNVRWQASQCPHSAPFQEIEDSKARSERRASHTISHILSLAGSFVARTVYVENKILVGTPSGLDTRARGGFINEVLLAAAQSPARGNLWDNRAPGLLYDCPRDVSSSLQIIAR